MRAEGIPATYYGKRAYVKVKVQAYLRECSQGAGPDVRDFINALALEADVSPRFVEKFFPLFGLRIENDVMVRA